MTMAQISQFGLSPNNDMTKKLPIYVVTSNSGKIQEIRSMLPGCVVASVTERLGPLPDIVEDGLTFEENALKKVLALPMIQEGVFLSDDSGICVTALGGRPGLYSARYGGNSSYEKCQALLAELGDSVERHAYFYCAIAVRFPDEQHLVVSGRLDGTIASAMRGENGFGYDPIFIPDGYAETISELPDKVKNTLSHRYRALQKIPGLGNLNG